MPRPLKVGVYQASRPPRAQGWAGTIELPASGLLVPRRDGKPLKVDSFRIRFWNLRTKLFGKGFNKTFHDFRETTSTKLSDAGCTENEIASIMGWLIGGEVPMSKNYVKRTRQRALNAFNKWQAAAFSEKDVVVPIRGSKAGPKPVSACAGN
jgi:integrase